MIIRVIDMENGFEFEFNDNIQAWEMTCSIRETFPDGEIRIEVE